MKLESFETFSSTGTTPRLKRLTTRLDRNNFELKNRWEQKFGSNMDMANKNSGTSIPKFSSGKPTFDRSSDEETDNNSSPKYDSFAESFHASSGSPSDEDSSADGKALKSDEETMIVRELAREQKLGKRPRSVIYTSTRENTEGHDTWESYLKALHTRGVQAKNRFDRGRAEHQKLPMFSNANVAVGGRKEDDDENEVDSNSTSVNLSPSQEPLPFLLDTESNSDKNSRIQFLDGVPIDWNRLEGNHIPLHQSIPYPHVDSLVGWATHQSSDSFCGTTRPNPYLDLPNRPLPPYMLQYLQKYIQTTTKNDKGKAGAKKRHPSDSVGDKMETSALVTMGMAVENILTDMLMPLARAHVERCRRRRHDDERQEGKKVASHRFYNDIILPPEEAILKLFAAACDDNGSNEGKRISKEHARLWYQSRKLATSQGEVFQSKIITDNLEFYENLLQYLPCFQKNIAKHRASPQRRIHRQPEALRQDEIPADQPPRQRRRLHDHQEDPTTTDTQTRSTPAHVRNENDVSR